MTKPYIQTDSEIRLAYLKELRLTLLSMTDKQIEAVAHQITNHNETTKDYILKSYDRDIEFVGDKVFDECVGIKQSANKVK
jgi:hypothetical protein